MIGFSQIDDVDNRTPLFHRVNVKYGVNLAQLLAGFVVLAAGVFYYLFCRTPEHTYFLRFLEGSCYSGPIATPFFSTIANSFPTLTHVFAFSVMTAALLVSRQRGYALVCFTWFAIDVCFELSQGGAATIIPLIPEWFSNVLFLENTKEYLLQGRFDYFDLASIAAGSTAAYWFLVKTKAIGREKK